MMFARQRINIVAATVVASILGGCQPTKPKKDIVGDQLMMLSYRQHGTWGDPVTVRVFLEEYLVLDHPQCAHPRSAQKNKIRSPAYCVIKINQGQSKAIEKAMEPFRKYAVPLDTFSLDGEPTSPDGKPCPMAFDFPLYSLMWTTTRGSRIATFDSGCRSKENPQFYRDLEAIKDILPIKEIVAGN